MKHFLTSNFLLCLFLLSKTEVLAYDCEIDGIYYNLTNGEATVTYKASWVPIYSGNIVIPSTIAVPYYLPLKHETIINTYTVTGIGTKAFKDCDELTSISIPSSITKIGDNAFSGCKKLHIVELNSNALVSQDREYRSLGDILGKQVQQIHLGDSILTVGKNSFSYCKNLVSVSFSDRITNIGESAFSGCSNLASIKIPRELKTISKYAFSGCDKLEKIIISDIGTWCNVSIGNLGLNKTNMHIYSDENTEITDLIIPEGITTIKKECFYGWSSLTSISFPSSLENIEDAAFYGCNKLTSLSFPLGIKTIGDYAFSGCSNIKNVILPESITTIGKYAFMGCHFSSITIPLNVEVIGEGAFYSSSENLKEVNIKSNSIVSKNYTEYGLSSIFGKTVEKYYIYEGVTAIGNAVFSGCINMRDITLPNSLIKIGNHSFSGCGGLTSLTIPNNVTAIGNAAFDGCMNMRDIILPNSLMSIGDNSFSGCTSLLSLVLPDNITQVSKNTFKNCNTRLYVNRGTISLLRLWEAEYIPYETGTETILFPTTLTVVSKTQTTAIIRVDNVYKEYTNFISEANSKLQLLNGYEIKMTKLLPDEYYNATIWVTIGDNIDTKNKNYYASDVYFHTQPINTKIDIIDCNASMISAIGSYEKGDATVIRQSLTINGKTFDGNQGLLRGLDPGNPYSIEYTVSVGYGKEEHGTQSYKVKATVSTDQLEMKTSQPKVVSVGNVIVSAESNVDDEEENVGFEWRRNDWTNDFASNTGGASLYEGTMEGYIRNLYTEKLWKFRPYYLSNTGTYYYGDWVGIDPTNTSHFEPTVHTYANINIEGNTALVKGYALRGTDNVVVQGFKYWRQVEGTRASMMPTGMPTDAMTVEANGQVMTATLKGLSYQKNYCYVAFATTSEGETFYGEQRQFTTGGNPTGINDMEHAQAVPVEVARYDMGGHRLSTPQRGLNIVRMSDGTVRKVMVR